MKRAVSGRGLVTRLATAIPLPNLPLESIEVHPFELDDLDALPAPIAAFVLDGDSVSVDELVSACASPRLVSVPKMIVARRSIVQLLADRIDAEEAVAGPLDALDPRDLARRLRTLCELGTTKIFVGMLQQAFEDGVTGLSITDVDGDQPIVAVSRAFERMTGYRQDEVIGRNCRFLRGSDGDDEQRTRFRESLARDRSAKMLVRNYRKDGTPFWNDLRVFAFRAQGVFLPLLGGVQHDVTELVEARSAIERLTQDLLAQQAFDHAVLDGVELGIVTTDEHGRVTYCNRAAREFLVLDEHQPAKLDALALDAPLEVLAGRPLSRTLVSRDGVERRVDVMVTHAHAAHGDLAFLLVLRDATRETKLQEEMRRVERLAAMGTMVAGFAHEVRNPVASLRTMTEALGEELTEAGLNMPHLKRMLHVLSRVERLISTLLQFGKPASPRPASHRPWSIISGALSTISARTRELGGPIRVEIEPDLPDVYVDEGQLIQVLVVLLSNALDAVGSSRRVLVRANSGADREPRSRPPSQPPAGTVVFEVIDDGPGVPREVEARMYDPFFTTKASGTGLGLSIAQQIVAENGGRLELASAAGPTVFAVTCPVA